MNRMALIDLKTVVAQGGDLLTSELDGETVMMSLAKSSYYGLDASAQRIWNLIARPLLVADLCERLIAEYEVDWQVCEREVCAFLNTLNSEGLIRIVAEAGQ